MLCCRPLRSRIRYPYGPLPTKTNEPQVNIKQLRVYLILINIFAIAVTAALQGNNYIVLFIFRICQGIASGMFLNLIPSYINELIPKHLASRFGVYPQFAVVIGVLTAYTVAMIITNCFQYQFLPTDESVANIIV
jgi:MFS family permease